MHCVPQRLRYQRFLKFFLMEGRQSRGPIVKKKDSNNVDLSLWGNCATTKHTMGCCTITSKIKINVFLNFSLLWRPSTRKSFSLWGRQPVHCPSKMDFFHVLVHCGSSPAAHQLVMDQFVLHTIYNRISFFTHLKRTKKVHYISWFWKVAWLKLKGKLNSK